MFEQDQYPRCWDLVLGGRFVAAERSSAIDHYIVNWQYCEMTIELEAGLKALANDRRLQILEWLKDSTVDLPRFGGRVVT